MLFRSTVYSFSWRVPYIRKVRSFESHLFLKPILICIEGIQLLHVIFTSKRFYVAHFLHFVTNVKTRVYAAGFMCMYVHLKNSIHVSETIFCYLLVGVKPK